MADEQLIIIFFGVFYILECFNWVPLNAVVFTRNLGKKYKWKLPFSIFGNSTFGLILSNPLPLFGQSLYFEDHPISFSTNSIFIFKRSHLNTIENLVGLREKIQYDDIQSLNCDKKKVIINGKVLHEFKSNNIARSVMELISKLKQSDLTARIRLIEDYLKNTLKTPQSLKKLEMIVEDAVFLRSLCIILFIFVFVCLPLLIWHNGLTYIWIQVLCAMVLLVSSITLKFYFLHKKYYPEMKWERFQSVLKIGLFPPASIRAYHELLSYYQIDSSYLTFALIKCHRDDFLKLAGLIYRNLVFYPEAESTNLGTLEQEELELYRLYKIRILRDFFKENGIMIKDIILPKGIYIDMNQRLCPKCHSIYNADSLVCSDCNIELLSSEDLEQINNEVV